MDQLLQYLTGDKEKVGIILKDGKIIEVDNLCEDPDGFEIDPAVFVQHEKNILATWHTHPKGTKVLSTGDYHSFMNWPDLDHYIVAPDGITKYVVRDGDLLID